MGFNKPILFIDHHMSHAASESFLALSRKPRIVTLDGVVEWDTTSIAFGDGNRIEMLKSLKFPHSIGLPPTAFTYFLGFGSTAANTNPMGLAPYGRPRYVSLIEEKLIDQKPDGSSALDMRYFTHPHTLEMVGDSFQTYSASQDGVLKKG